MATIELTVGGETIELDVADQQVEQLTEVNAAVGRELSVERFAARAIRTSKSALSQSIEQSILRQHQAVREAQANDVPLEQVSNAWERPEPD